MAAILGFTEVLRTFDLSDSERLDALKRIEKSGKGLLSLIDDILDLAKIEAGKISTEKKRISPHEVVSEVVELLRLQAEQRKLQLRLTISDSVPQIVHSDAVRVRQILTNLIGNAIKFTKTGVVTLKVGTDFKSEAQASYLTFDIIDTGLGIAEADQEHLFQPFAQADGSIARKFGGTGLGLALSRRLAQELGGDLILIKSIPNIGSHFFAKIEAGPFDQFLPNESGEKNPDPYLQELNSSKALEGARVLVVDDAPDNRFLMRRFLEQAGALVEHATGGKEALEMAMIGDYDVILMDIQMPEIDGITATRRLRAQGFKIPILAVSAHAMPSEIARSHEAGCNEHLTKPCAKATLIATVKKYLQYKNLERLSMGENAMIAALPTDDNL
jgi:CheY-like chemotaxis protein